MWTYLNGAYVAADDAMVSVDDRGFLFGDGVYEVVRAHDGHLFELQPHVDRLAFGVDALALPGVARSELRAMFATGAELLRRNALDRGDATVYVQITRGAARRTHAFPPRETPPTVYVATAPLTPNVALHQAGGAAITCPDIRWARCDIKTVNLLPNVLAKQQAVEAGANEAIFVRDGAITDGASSNVFAVIDGTLRTPPLSNYLLPGVTRRVVLELAGALGIPTREATLFAHDLRDADELFITATTIDVLPLSTLDARAVGSGAPGPITRRLERALAARLADTARVGTP